MVEKYDVGDLNQGYDWAVKFLRWSQLERGQLYGTLAFIMNKYNLQDVDITTDELNSMKDAYWVQFLDSGKEGIMRVHLKITEPELIYTEPDQDLPFAEGE